MSQTNQKFTFSRINLQSMMATVNLLLISSCLLQWSNAFTPVVYDAKVLPTSQCDESNVFENDPKLMETLTMAVSELPPPGCNLPSTCKDVLRCNPSASSGYYQIQAINGSAVQVYCDMEGTNCGGEGGWTVVGHINVTDPSSQCTAGFRVETANGKSFCIRDTNAGGCRAMIFETFGHAYSQVCGYIQGYAYYSPSAFDKGASVLLSDNYVDGISITTNTTSPTHIWTYAAGNVEVNNNIYACPCNTNSTATNNVPQYVGSDYYCEAAVTSTEQVWYTNDTLWDGMQCGGVEGPCCNHTGLPWFKKDLPSHTTAAISIRICLDMDTLDENIGIESMKLLIRQAP